MRLIDLVAGRVERSRTYTPLGTLLRIVAPLIVTLALTACGSESSIEGADTLRRDPANHAIATTPLPHVVLYLVDTLRADRLGCYGDQHNTSPFIDELANVSVRFEQALSQAPWTLPAVVSLLTSSYPTTHRVTSAGLRASSKITTLAKVLSDHGYTTAGFIYNTLGGSDGGLVQGYDYIYEPPNVLEMTDSERARDPTTLRPFLEWFEKTTIDGPRFFYIHTLEPHWPYEGIWSGREAMTTEELKRQKQLNEMIRQHRSLATRQALAERGGPSLDSDSAAQLSGLGESLRRSLGEIDALYEGDIRHADEELHRVVDALKRKGIWDDTVFILVSDHGEEFYDHGNWFHGQSLYDELVRVPLIVHIPGVTDAGTQIEAPVQLVDIAPTITDLLGIKTPADWQGRSLLPLIRGEGRPQPAFTTRINSAYGAANTGDEGEGRESAVRRGRYKAIFNHLHWSVRLFDVVADPHELVDLARVHPRITADLRELVLEWLEETTDQAYPAPDRIPLGQKEPARVKS